MVWSLLKFTATSNASAVQVKLRDGRCWGTSNVEEIFQIRAVARLRMVLGGGHTQLRNRSFLFCALNFSAKPARPVSNSPSNTTAAIARRIAILIITI